MPGVITRAPKDKNHPYVIISRAIADDRRLSIAARGLLFLIMTKPDDWYICPTALAHECNCGPTQISTLLKELEHVGYLRRQRGQDAGGRWIWYSQVSETPTANCSSVNGSAIDGYAIHGQPVNGSAVDGSVGDIPMTDLPSITDDRVLSSVAPSDADAAGGKESVSPVVETSKPKRERKPRAPTEWERQRHELGKTFADQTGLGSDGLGFAERERRWWSPLKTILAAAKGDMAFAQQLIVLAIEQGRKSKLTLASPQSIEQIAIALSATTTPRGDGAAGTVHQQDQHWEAW
jgi:hypothetical protein